MLAALPVLYALSIGPVYALMPNEWNREGQLVTFYYPLWRAADEAGVSGLVQKYVQWWIELFW